MEIKNRVTKYDLYEILNSKSELAQHLPPMQLVSNFNSILEFIECYKKVILKPIISYNAQKIYVIEKLGGNFKITDYTKKKISKFILEDIEGLQDFFKRDESYFQKCLVQRFIKLAKIDEEAFDMKVIMKRTREGKWSMYGIEFRAGGNNFLFTNVYKEDFYLSLNEVIKKYYPLHFNLERKINEIKELCLKACIILDDFLDYIHKINFDIAIDEDNKIWIVEINALENMKKFFVVDYNIYCSIKYIPLLHNISSYNSKSK